MKKKNFIKIFVAASFVVYFFAMLQSCGNSTDSISVAESVDEQRLLTLGKEYVYFDHDSLYLNLSKDEAVRKGVSRNEYFTLIVKLREMNLFLKETLDGLAEGKKLHFSVPKNRICDSLNVSDKFSINYLNPQDLLQNDYEASTRATSFQVCSIDGSPRTERAKHNQGTYDIELNGATKCTFGLVRAAATVGTSEIETGTGFVAWTAKASAKRVYCDGYITVSVAGTCECWGTLIIEQRTD